MLRSRAALLEALLVLLEQKPFDQITIREIARTAGVGYATFFRHYPTKEALLEELASDQIDALLQLTLPVLYETNSHNSTIALFSYVDEHRKLWTALLTGGAAGIVRETFLRQAKQIQFPDEKAPSWLPRDLGVVYATTATAEIIAWWLQHGQHLSVAEIAGILNRLVISPTISPDTIG
jgi:AcrR family transcriptional regulator